MAEERSVIQISFGTQGPNVRQAQSGICVKNYSWSTIQWSANPFDLPHKSTIRALFKVKSVDPKTYSPASIGKEWLISWIFASKFGWKAIHGFCADLRKVFNETRRSYSIYSGFIPQYEIVPFTSKLIKHNKKKQKNQDIKNIFTILVASSSIFFMQLDVVCLTFEILFTILNFFNIWDTLLSIIVCFLSFVERTVPKKIVIFVCDMNV